MKFMGLIFLLATYTLQVVLCQEESLSSTFVSVHEVETTTDSRLSKVKGDKRGTKGGGNGQTGGRRATGRGEFSDDYNDKVNFGSTVMVDFTGRPPMSHADMEALADAFVKTYNDLSASQCGEGVRVIRDAELQDLGTFFPMTLRVSGVVCSGSSPTLFSSSNCRRNLHQEATQDDKMRIRGKGPEQGRRNGGEKGGSLSAACPPPSKDQFTQVYSEAVKGLNIDTIVETDDFVVQVTELVEVPCKEEGSYEYLADVECELGEDLSEVTRSEISTLEQSYETSYNEVNAFNPELCDPEFHVVTSVEIISYNRRRHGRRLQRRGIFRHRVSGRNRGSSRSSGFNDGFRRLHAMGMSVEEPLFLRELQTDTCLCPKDAEFREPSIAEFVDQFNTNVENLAARGELKVCIGILGVVLIPPDGSVDSEEIDNGSPSPLVSKRSASKGSASKGSASKRSASKGSASKGPSSESFRTSKVP